MKISNTAIPAACVVLLAGLVVSGLGLAESTNQSAMRASARESAGELFWNKLRVTGDEVEGYDTLHSMAEAADAVVIGHATAFRLSRRIQGDAPEDVVSYAALDVSVDTVVRGATHGPTVVLELLVPLPDDRVEGLVTEQSENVPQQPMLLFLREKAGAAEEGLYRLVEFRGLWVAEDGKLQAPLAAHPVSESGEVTRSPAEVLRDYEADQAARSRAVQEGKLLPAQAHAGLVPSVRRGGEPLPSDDVSEEQDEMTAEEKFAAELQGVTSVEALAQRLAP